MLRNDVREDRCNVKVKLWYSRLELRGFIPALTAGRTASLS